MAKPVDMRIQTVLIYFLSCEKKIDREKISIVKREEFSFTWSLPQKISGHPLLSARSYPDSLERRHKSMKRCHEVFYPFHCDI